MENPAIRLPVVINNFGNLPFRKFGFLPTTNGQPGQAPNCGRSRKIGVEMALKTGASLPRASAIAIDCIIMPVVPSATIQQA